MFHQLSVLPGVWPSAELLGRLHDYSELPPLILDEWPADLGALSRSDALLAGWKDHLDASRLSQLPDLRYIGLRATSTARVDLEYAAARSVTVAPIHGYGDTGTVEFVIERLLHEVRHARAVRGELAGERLGVIGWGSVGQSVGAVAAALGMEVVFHTPNRRADHRWAPLTEVLNSGFLSFHSPAYRHIVGPEELRLIPAAAFVIITTLGLPMAEADLLAWQSGRTGRVALDLCAADALSPRDIPGLEVHNLYAARTSESVRRAEDQLLANLEAACRGKDERR